MSVSVSVLVGLETSAYFNIAGMAILIYDYMITLKDEVRLIWGRGWDVTRFFFTVARYLPFVGVGMTAYSALRPASLPCAPKLENNIIHILGIIAAEVLLIIRTYAFWQCDKRVLYGLIGYAGVTIGLAILFNVVHVIPNSQANIPMNLDCLVATRNSALVYSALLVFEMLVLFLTAYQRLRAYREVRAQIVRTTFWDGIFYILCIMREIFTSLGLMGLPRRTLAVVTLANVILAASFPLQFSNLLDTPQITLHSVLSSRIMFNLRKSSYDVQNRTTDLVWASDVPYNVPSTYTRSLATESDASGSNSRDLIGNEVDDLELARLIRTP